MAHLLANLVQFIRLLRLYGLQVSPENSVTASRALQYIDIGNRTEFKHALRCVLVHRNEDIDLFEQVFQEFWSSPSDTQNRLNLHPLGSERRFGEPVVEMASLTGSSDGTQDEDGLRVERVQIATYSNVRCSRKRISRTLQQKKWNRLLNCSMRCNGGLNQGDPNAGFKVPEFTRSSQVVEQYCSQ